MWTLTTESEITTKLIQYIMQQFVFIILAVRNCVCFSAFWGANPPHGCVCPSWLKPPYRLDSISLYPIALPLHFSQNPRNKGCFQKILFQTLWSPTWFFHMVMAGDIRGWPWAVRGEKELFHFLCSYHGIFPSTYCLCDTECGFRCWDPCMALYEW